MCNITDSQFWKERVANEKRGQPVDDDPKAVLRRPAVAPCPWATEDIVMGVSAAYLKEQGASTKRAGSQASSRAGSRAGSQTSSRGGSRAGSAMSVSHQSRALPLSSSFARPRTQLRPSNSRFRDSPRVLVRSQGVSVTSTQVRSLETMLLDEQTARQKMELEIAQLKAILEKAM